MTVELFLVSADAGLVARACDRRRPENERAAAVVVDWERRGKVRRQAMARGRIGTDTQIGSDTPDDLARVRATVAGPVICRVNALGPWTAGEVDLAVRLGADEVLVPMVRAVSEAEAILRLARDRIGVGLMIETVDAVERSAALAALPISRAYVGLMDLALDRGSRSIFTAVADGAVERVRGHVTAPFGFGGLTVPGCGHPVPTLLLLAEMARLDCEFTFLRRSFIADVGAADMGAAVADLRAAAKVAGRRAPGVIDIDRQRLVDCIDHVDRADCLEPVEAVGPLG